MRDGHEILHDALTIERPASGFDIVEEINRASAYDQLQDNDRCCFCRDPMNPSDVWDNDVKSKMKERICCHYLLRLSSDFITSVFGLG